MGAIHRPSSGWGEAVLPPTSRSDGQVDTSRPDGSLLGKPLILLWLVNTLAMVQSHLCSLMLFHELLILSSSSANDVLRVRFTLQSLCTPLRSFENQSPPWGYSYLPPI